MFVQNLIAIQTTKNGYIAGSGDGIVTVNGQPAARSILLYEPVGAFGAFLTLIARQTSLANGHYLFLGLDPNKRYMLMCRDLEPNGAEQRYEPVVWDYVTPANDLTGSEQQELWQSWQIST